LACVLVDTASMVAVKHRLPWGNGRLVLFCSHVASFFQVVSVLSIA